MRDPFELEDSEGAQGFLTSLTPSVRRKGEDCFREGRVRELEVEQPGGAFAASVFDGLHVQRVELFHTEEEGWDATCSCPAALNCKHAYAAMKALLAEHSGACVRNLSAGKPPAASKPKSPEQPPKRLPEQLSAALGRPLRKEESAFLEKLTQVYKGCCAGRCITGWDFAELGLHLSGSSWERLHIWPSFPSSEHEFWLYIANALFEAQKPIPAFMEAVTDLSVVRDGLERWRRTREIDRWRELLENATREARAPVAFTDERTDLRVKLLEKSAALERSLPDTGRFEPLKQNHFRQLEADYNAGQARFTPEAELIWQCFRQRFYSGSGALQLPYYDLDSKRALARLFKLSVLNERLVNAQGEIFIRPTEPLRWTITPAENARDNYRLRLVQADGTPLPPCLVTLPGVPPFYVTPTTLFTGPGIDDTVLRPGEENVIPAPAIESGSGVRFLNYLGVEMPPRLRDRVQQVHLRVKIVCALAMPYPGSSAELCTVSVRAKSDDGLIEETWNMLAWQEAAPSKQRKRREKGDSFVLYDRSALKDIPRLMQPLELKWGGYQTMLSTRVTKKFPELFVNWLKSLPPHIEVQLDGELASLARDPVAAEVKLDVDEVTVDWFDLKVVLNVSDTELTAPELKLLLDAKGRYVRLGKKGWRRLQFNLTAEEDEDLARLGLNPHELNSEPQRLHALQLADKAASRFLPEPQVAEVQRRATEIKASVTPDLPAEVRADLRPYQREGFHFLAYLSANRFGGILADDMGLGKTLQALVWLAWLRSQPGNAARPTLVVCPKSVMDVWRAEGERFTPSLRVKVWHPSELNSLLDRLSEADLHVLNYSQLRIAGESLAPAAWLAVILDEGQYIKNPSSQTAQVARALRADHRLALSGTPIENRLLDLWSLMAFVMPGVLGSRAYFARVFDQKGDPLARRRLSARVRPFLLRRTKTQVAKDLPDRIEEDVYCEIEGEQKTLYRAELKRAQQLLLGVKTQQQLAKERFHFLTSLLRLRQICCHPALVNPGSKAESAKVSALLEQIEPLMEEGHKVLVFSQFVTMLDLLRPTLFEKGWPLFYLAGDTENRGELVERFQSAKDAAVFLISLKAGGFGLNLTSASYVVLFDPWWNPAVESQAIDRTHRIGQLNKVIAYRLLIKDSIEEKIRALQKQKSALAEDVLGEEKFSQALTLEDLQFLFAD